MNKKLLRFGIAIGLFAVLLSIVVLLPAILSTNFGKNLVVTQVDEFFPGKLEIEDWSLSWFGRLIVQGIRYDLSEDGFWLDIREVINKQGLFGLITNLGHLGEIEVKGPDIYLDLLSLKNKENTLPGQQNKEKSEPGTLDKFPPMRGHIEISDGTIRYLSDVSNEEIIAKEINIVIDAGDLNAPIVYQINVKSNDEQGQITGKGSILLANDVPLNLDNIKTEAKLNIKNWDVGGITKIAGLFSNIPEGKGRLGADVKLSGSISTGFHIIGNADIPELKLWGGPLQSDKPVVKNIDFKLDSIKQESSFKVNQLDIQSSLLNISADGIIHDRTRNSVQSHVSADLSEIFNQLPKTVKLREGTKISDGNLQLNVQMETVDGKTSFNGDGLISQLKGISNGKKLSWKKPVDLKAHGEIHPNGFWLEKFSVQSEFFKGDGHGDLSNMSINISADLKKALGELKKFIEIKDWDGSGKLKANLQIKPVNDQSSNATSKVTIKNFELIRNNKRIVARQNISADLSTNINIQSKQNEKQFTNLSFNFASHIGSGNLKADRIDISSSEKLPVADNIVFSGKFDLKRVAALLQNFDIITKGIFLGGNSTIRAKGALNNNSILLSSTKAEISKFRFKHGKKSLQENKISLNTKGGINLDTRSLHLSPLDIISSSGKVHIPELVISDWLNIQNAIKTKATLNLNLANTFKTYKDFISLPADSHIIGKSEIDLDIDLTDIETQSLKMNGNIAPLKYISKKLPTISEDNVTFNLDLKFLPHSKLYNIQDIKINSQILRLKANGNLKQEKNRNILQLAGVATPDLKLISKLLNSKDRNQVEIIGKSERPFKLELISMHSNENNLLQNINFDGTVFVKSVKTFGMDIVPGDIPIRVANSKATADVHATANSGRLIMKPTIDMRKDPYVISFSENTDFMNQVQITDPMAQTFLSTIHPLFAGSIDSGGIIDLFMKHFNWPLDNAHTDDIAFAGNLRINELKMIASPILNALLSVAGINENRVHLDNQQIEFTAENGRINTSLVQFSADGYSIGLEGSVGFDKTLNYIAHLPITQKMVGRDAYEYMQGVTIDVPIRGTVAKPKIDNTAIEKATGSIVKQSLKKTIERQATDLLQQLFKK